MKAVCWHGARDIRVDTVPEPSILNPRDAIIKVTSTAICGSDLHLYNGVIPTMKAGDVLGHEFMGEVVEVGKGNTKLAIGDRVVVPFTIACALATRQRQGGTAMASLDLALIGNGTVGAFVDERGEINWACFPRFDSDPMFCSLLKDRAGKREDVGFFAIEILDEASVEQRYQHNTPVLITRLTDTKGGAIEITDFAPRFEHHGRTFCPMMMVRRIRRLSGHPRIRVRCRPRRTTAARSPGSRTAPTTSATSATRWCCVSRRTPPSRPCSKNTRSSWTTSSRWSSAPTKRCRRR